MLKSYMYTHRRGILAFFLMMIAAACIIRLYRYRFPHRCALSPVYFQYFLHTIISAYSFQTISSLL